MLPIDKAKSPAFWDDVRTKDCFKDYRAFLLKEWEIYGDSMPIPELRYRDFKLFEETGNRSIYQKPYFDRRHSLSVSALLSLIYPEEAAYFDRLLDIIFAICDEYTWALPAHLAHINADKATRIELFSACTGLYLAEIYTLLYDRLPPLIRERIEKELDRRIISPYLAVDRYYWEYTTNNWAAVCLAGVVGTMILMAPDKARAKISRFENTIAGYLSGFEDDGVCLEGGSYWDYGFGHFLIYADYMDHFSDGKINHFGSQKVKEIALYPQRAYLGNGEKITFSDSSGGFTWEVGRMHFLKTKYSNEIVLFDKKYTIHSTTSFSALLRDVLWYNEAYNNESDAEKASEYFTPLSEWYVRKNKHYSFAAKGGNNDEPHNHNDVGSFIFARNGKQILADIGQGEYTRQYFSDERYDILEPSSRSHSVPILGGKHQLAGKEHRAEGFSYKDGILSFDISLAYGLKVGEGVVRRFVLDERSITLADVFAFDGEITERLVTLYEPRLLEDGTVEIEGARITYNADEWKLTLGKEERTHARGEYCYFLDFTPLKESKEFLCKME